MPPSAKKQKQEAPSAGAPRVGAFVNYLNAAISNFHCVAEIKRILTAAGFSELDTSKAWALSKGGKYFFTKAGTAIVAFAVGGKYDPDTSGAIIVGAHTDSPCLKLKPVSKLEKSESVLLGVVGYGGGLWHTWFDRDLSVAGRVLVKGSDGKTTAKLVKIPKPIARISNLAIHLLTADERSSQGFKPSLQNHAPPILATTLQKALWETTVPPSAAGTKNGGASPQASARNHPLLIKLIADELKVDAAAIEDFELQLIDMQPACVGGALDEFVYSGRLDNQCSCFQGIAALVESIPSLASDSSVRCVALFDHEEVGSCSAMGAEGPLMNDTLNRISAGLAAGSPSASADPNAAAFRARSFHLSTDMAHAVHPNYSDRHDGEHGPKLGQGLVIKHNANQRYATTSVSATMVRRFGALAGEVIQEFAVKADSACGSTIGPIISAGTGVRTCDVGVPQLSMHSIREVMHVDDVDKGTNVLKAAFENYSKVYAEVAADEVVCPACE